MMEKNQKQKKQKCNKKQKQLRIALPRTANKEQFKQTNSNVKNTRRHLLNACWK